MRYVLSSRKRAPASIEKYMYKAPVKYHSVSSSTSYSVKFYKNSSYLTGVMQCVFRLFENRFYFFFNLLKRPFLNQDTIISLFLLR